MSFKSLQRSSGTTCPAELGYHSWPMMLQKPLFFVRFPLASPKGVQVQRLKYCSARCLPPPPPPLQSTARERLPRKIERHLAHMRTSPPVQSTTPATPQLQAIFTPRQQPQRCSAAAAAVDLSRRLQAPMATKMPPSFSYPCYDLVFCPPPHPHPLLRPPPHPSPSPPPRPTPWLPRLPPRWPLS